MKSPASFQLVLAGLVGLLVAAGCGGKLVSAPGSAGGSGGGSPISPGGSTMDTPSPVGSDPAGPDVEPGGLAGSEVGGTFGAAGTLSAAGTFSVGGAPSFGGAAGAPGFAGGVAVGGVGGTAGPITDVVPTPGCGMVAAQTPGMAVRGTIQTAGVKDPDCADRLGDGTPICGPWSYEREYFVTLPLGYDSTKAYPLVFQGPGCGGNGSGVSPLDDPAPNGPANVGNTVIRVGLTPPPTLLVGHGTNPGQGCFDESEGNDSVEWPFYENLYDLLAGQLCFDKNRVFVNGTLSGGGRFADELACKYAGDANRPIRGVISNAGDFPLIPQFLPTCSTMPMAGIWVHQIADTERQWNSAKHAVDRAMMVDGCTIGTGYDDAMFDDFPIGSGNPDDTCKRIKGCPELTPLVVCLLPGKQHSSNSQVADPGASTFIKLFENPPLIAP